MYSTGKLVDGKGVVTNAKGGTSYHNHGLAINEDNIEKSKLLEIMKEALLEAHEKGDV